MKCPMTEKDCLVRGCKRLGCQVARLFRHPAVNLLESTDQCETVPTSESSNSGAQDGGVGSVNGRPEPTITDISSRYFGKTRRYAMMRNALYLMDNYGRSEFLLGRNGESPDRDADRAALVAAIVQAFNPPPQTPEPSEGIGGTPEPSERQEPPPVADPAGTTT